MSYGENTSVDKQHIGVNYVAVSSEFNINKSPV